MNVGPDGKVNEFKARLMAKEHTQILGWITVALSHW